MADKPQAQQNLIRQAQSGDLEAFNSLVLMFQNQVYSTTYRIMGEPAAAADMAQDAFITAYRKIKTYRGGSFKGWLLRIATNTCYDELRKLKRRPAVGLDDLPDAENDDGPALPSNEQTPEQAAQQTELSEAIQQCINALKADQRIVMIMSDVQGMNYQEIADTIQVKLGTVKSRLSRARRDVRDCLQGFEELLPTEYRLFSKD